MNVTTELVQEAFDRGGSRAVMRLWPRLLADFAAALCSEYRDLCRTFHFTPQRISVACLLVSASVWSLIVAASVLEWHWAARALGANLALTMLLAFGAPPAALAVSGLSSAAPKRNKLAVTCTRLSAAATIGTWSLLVCHLAEHA